MKKMALYGAFSVALAAGLLVAAGAANAQSYSQYYPQSSSAYSYSYSSYDPYASYGYGGYSYDPCMYDPYSYGCSFGNYYDPYSYWGGWYGGYGNYYCYYYSWYPGCGTYQYPGTLSITGVSGPTSLRVGEQGVWSITTSASSNSYVSVSVRWGDENTYPYAGAYADTQVYQQNTFTHTYRQAGTYTITFTATDSYGRSESATRTVVVSGGTVNPNEQFNATPVSGRAPLAVAFRTTNLDPYATYYLDFGDGTPAVSRANATHTYDRRGTYTATLSKSASCMPNTPCPMYLQHVGTVTIDVQRRLQDEGPTGGCWLDPNSGYYVCY